MKRRDDAVLQRDRAEVADDAREHPRHDQLGEEREDERTGLAQRTGLGGLLGLELGGLKSKSPEGHAAADRPSD
jgi:hypothetical protein